MKLFIVESPNKCGKLRKYLGSDYKVAASVGHVRSIPKKGINIDIKNGFIPKFEILADKKRVVKELKDLSSKAKEIILATDPDREGEAIAWHIYELLPQKDKQKCKRVTFNQITKKAVTDALKHPRHINMDLVDAQKTRQVLDRLIGYKISPVLWYTAHISNSSAGRVQSIALKLICEKQKEIEAFKPQTYWFINALLKSKNGDFWAKVVTKNKDNKYLQDKIVDHNLEKLKNAKFELAKAERKEKKINANPPFDTNSLQRACSTLFGWSLSKSKRIAQSLYESGLVTYIRSDSFSIAEEAVDEVRELITKAASKEYLPTKPIIYSKKSSNAAQEAHECIRPTHVYDKGDDIGNNDEFKMYKLIRDRFIACQMSSMVIDTVTYTIKTNTNHTLIAKGQTIKFDGWNKVYKYSKTKEEVLPEVKESEKLDLKDIKKSKHTTKPPPRHNEGSLVKKMEDEGVGRPSTRDSIITSIQKKGYVEKEKDRGKKGLVATPLGLQIYEYLQPNFNQFFMDLKYTSQVENNLDKVANGEESFLKTTQEFYDNLTKFIKQAGAVNTEDRNKSTGLKCTVCKKGDIVEKVGKYGVFYGCSRYKEGCKTIFVKNDDDTFSVKQKKKIKKVGRKCPKCEKSDRDGELLERTNKKTGSKFIGCSLFPKCKYIESLDDTTNIE